MHTNINKILCYFQNTSYLREVRPTSEDEKQLKRHSTELPRLFTFCVIYTSYFEHSERLLHCCIQERTEDFIIFGILKKNMNLETSDLHLVPKESEITVGMCILMKLGKRIQYKQKQIQYSSLY